MKGFFSVVLSGVFLSVSVVSLCSCENAPEEETVSGEDISYVSMGSDTADMLEDVITNYLSAVTEQDHIGIMSYTTEDFIWNYDETAFYDYSRYITDFSVTDVDEEHIMCRENEYTVPVSYVLTYSGVHTDDNGESQDAGEYEYSRNFIIIYEEDRYLISDITEMVMG